MFNKMFHGIHMYHHVTLCRKQTLVRFVIRICKFKVIVRYIQTYFAVRKFNLMTEMLKYEMK